MKLHTLTYPSVLPAINKNSQQPNLMTVFLAGICEADEIPSSIFKDLVSISRTLLKFRQGVSRQPYKPPPPTNRHPAKRVALTRVCLQNKFLKI
jgi:hypothetical protein